MQFPINSFNIKRSFTVITTVLLSGIEEKEYDGGWLNFIAGLAVSVAGWGLGWYASKTGSKKAKYASAAFTIVGAALTLGTLATTTVAVSATNATLTTAKGAEFAYSTTVGLADTAVSLTMLSASR